MNELIIIGCPYTSMSNLDMAFREIGGCRIKVINCDDVVAIDTHSLYTRNGGASYRLDDFTSSFVRYPYDLIPPHSKTYELREEIEFYKTLALAVDSVSINSLASTWMLRNRAFSLSKAHVYGVSIAEYTAVKNGSVLPVDGTTAVKALGNCFVSHSIDTISPDIKEMFRIEEDDGDIAAIFPASSFNAQSISVYLSSVGVAFLQREIKPINEYRGYIIGEVPFVYIRDKVDAFDKSAAKYISTSYECKYKTVSGLMKLMNKFGLGYLCFDFLIDEYDTEIVIDINPYGSMPNYSSHPEPSLQLAKLLLRTAK